MATWHKSNSIIQQVFFIIERAKGDFILFGSVQLMFKWSDTLHGMHKFSFFKQTTYIVMMANVSFDYVLLHSRCPLHFFFLCFHRIHLHLQTDKLFYNFQFTDYLFVFTILEWTSFLVPGNIEQMLISIEAFIHVMFEYGTWENPYW